MSVFYYKDMSPAKHVERIQYRSQMEIFSGEDVIKFSTACVKLGYAIWQEELTYIHPPPPFCRIYYVHKGTILLEMNDTEIVLNEGEVYLIPSGIPFTITYFKGLHLMHWYVQVKDEKGGPLFSNLVAPIALESPETANTLSVIWEAPFKRDEALYQEISKNDCFNRLYSGDDEWLLSGEGNAIITRFALQKKMELRQKYKMHKKFSVLMNELTVTPPGCINSLDLAKKMGISRTSFSTSFRREMGISFRQFLMNYAVERACEMLLFSDMKVEDISDALGYSDRHNFSRMFKKNTDMTPAEYRRHSHIVRENEY